MEHTGYLKLTGANQAKIDGSCKRKEREGDIVISAFSHNIYQPHGGDAGLGNAAIYHEPIQFEKEVDKSSPKLYQALLEKELLEFEFSWFRFDDTGKEQMYYQIKLSQAKIIKASPYTPNAFENHSGHIRFMEKISVMYDKIAWSWGEFGDISYESIWREVNV